MQAHEILERIACAQTLPLRIHSVVSSGASSQTFGLSLYPFFMDASSEGSGESVHELSQLADAISAKI